jgi:Poxvirus A22 protein
MGLTMRVLSIDIGRENTAIAVVNIEADYLLLEQVWQNEHKLSTMSSNSLIQMCQALNLLIEDCRIDKVVIEQQLSAFKGQSNLNIAFNKFVQGFLAGYFKCDVVEFDPRLRLKFCRQTLGLRLKASTHRENKILAMRTFKTLDIIVPGEVDTQMKAFSKQDDIMDAVVQAVAYFESLFK